MTTGRSTGRGGSTWTRRRVDADDRRHGRSRTVLPPAASGSRLDTPGPCRLRRHDRSPARQRASSGEWRLHAGARARGRVPGALCLAAPRRPRGRSENTGSRGRSRAGLAMHGRGGTGAGQLVGTIPPNPQHPDLTRIPVPSVTVTAGPTGAITARCWTPTTTAPRSTESSRRARMEPGCTAWPTMRGSRHSGTRLQRITPGAITVTPATTARPASARSVTSGASSSTGRPPAASTG